MATHFESLFYEIRLPHTEPQSFECLFSKLLTRHAEALRNLFLRRTVIKPENLQVCNRTVKPLHDL